MAVDHTLEELMATLGNIEHVQKIILIINI